VLSCGDPFSNYNSSKKLRSQVKSPSAKLVAILRRPRRMCRNYPERIALPIPIKEGAYRKRISAHLMSRGKYNFLVLSREKSTLPRIPCLRQAEIRCPGLTYRMAKQRVRRPQPDAPLIWQAYLSADRWEFSPGNG